MVRATEGSILLDLTSKKTGLLEISIAVNMELKKPLQSGLYALYSGSVRKILNERGSPFTAVSRQCNWKPQLWSLQYICAHSADIARTA